MDPELSRMTSTFTFIFRGMLVCTPVERMLVAGTVAAAGLVAGPEMAGVPVEGVVAVLEVACTAGQGRISSSSAGSSL
jgi:hypothetical protein